MAAERRARIQRLLEAARRIADPQDPLGREARLVLPAATRLSPAGIELAFERCLELSPSDAELARLEASVFESARAHVLLSANVFTAAHRAIALALAASARVFVRPSRRAPHLAELLARAAPDLFEVVPRLLPERGEPVFAYGSDSTLEALRSELPPGVLLAAHGPGYGLVALQASDPNEDWSAVVRGLALDLALFDQRGCLSPRLVLFEGGLDAARPFVAALRAALAGQAAATPLGELDANELAELSRQRAAFAYAGEVTQAGNGFIALLRELRGFPEVSARSVAIVVCDDAAAEARRRAHEITTYAVAGTPAFCSSLARALPDARRAEPGTLQDPPLDGPVDRRTRWYTLPG